MKNGDHNTGVSDGTKNFFNLKKSTLSKKKDNSIKKLYEESKKVPYQKSKKWCLVKEPNLEHKKVLYQKS